MRNTAKCVLHSEHLSERQPVTGIRAASVIRLYGRTMMRASIGKIVLVMIEQFSIQVATDQFCTLTSVFDEGTVISYHIIMYALTQAS